MSANTNVNRVAHLITHITINHVISTEFVICIVFHLKFPNKLK